MPITTKLISSTGSLTTVKTLLVGLSAQPTGTAGRITITDGQGGTALFDIDTPASATATVIIDGFIDQGIAFPSGMYVSALTNITSATVQVQGGIGVVVAPPPPGDLPWSTLDAAGWAGITETTWGEIVP